VEIGWIGQKRIKTREQTYMELMVEMMEEFIKELTHNKLTYGKEVNVRTYTYAQLDCKYDALCLKDKNTVLRGL
jgi:hypothetical protein